MSSIISVQWIPRTCTLWKKWGRLTEGKEIGSDVFLLSHQKILKKALKANSYLFQSCPTFLLHCRLYQSENGSETSFCKQRSYWKEKCHAWLMKSSDSWGNFDLHFKSKVISTQNRFRAKKKVNSAFPWRQFAKHNIWWG